MLLITPQEIIDNAFSPREEISAQLIRPSKIDIAQEFFVRPKVGDKMYECLENGKYEQFNDKFIKPALAYFVRYSIVEELCVALGDNGAIFYSGSLTTENDAQNVDQNAKVTMDNENNTSTKDSVTITDKENSVVTKDVETNGSTNSSIIDITGSASQTITDNKTIKNNDFTDQIGNKENTSTKIASQAKENSWMQIKSDELNKKLSQENTKNSKSYTQANRILIHRLQIRALADAGILIEKAVKHLKANNDLYPEFDANVERFYF